MKVLAVRRIAVDTEPARGSGRLWSEVSNGELADLPEGPSWRRISSAEAPLAAAELLMEQARLSQPRNHTRNPLMKPLKAIKSL